MGRLVNGVYEDLAIAVVPKIKKCQKNSWHIEVFNINTTES